MATTIVTKNSSTAAAVPTAAQLVQGELAVNVADKRLYTEDSVGGIVELGTNPSTLTVAGEITANGGIALGDNDKATFGASDDLQIYHDGNSFISDNGAGNLYLTTNDAAVVLSNADGSKPLAIFNNNADSTVYFNGTAKLATTATGIDVTGTATMDGLTVDGAAVVRAGNTLTLNRTDNAIGGAMSYVAGTGFIFNDANGDGTSFNVGAANRMRIDTAGNVGIGTSSPSYKADILATNQYALRLNTTDADGCFLAIQTNGTAKGYLGTSHHLVAGTPSENDITLRAENNLQFTTGGGSERMRIDSSGRAYFSHSGAVPAFGSHTGVISTTAQAGYQCFTAHNTATSGTRYFGYFLVNGGSGYAVGSITSTGSSTAYNTTSDYRLKEDDVPMTGATERVKALRPVNFAWKADGSRVDGFFAHELAEVVPEATTGSKDAMKDEEYEVTPAVLDDDGNVVTEAVMGTRSVPDYQGIDQSKLVPLLVATIQELEARITQLENN